MFIDDETGECLEELTLDQEDEIFDLTNDAETGEPRVSDIEILRGRKVPFQVYTCSLKNNNIVCICLYQLKILSRQISLISEVHYQGHQLEKKKFI